MQFLSSSRKPERQYSFETVLLFTFIGAVLGVLTLSYIQGNLPAKPLVGPGRTTVVPHIHRGAVNAIPIEHLPAGPMRFSVTKINVAGHPTLILYDKEMGTQFIADADGILNWAATNPAGR